MIFYGKTNGETVQIDNPPKFKEFISSLKDSRIEVKIRKYVKSRTLPQNSLYWLQLQFLGKETGEDDIDGLHNYFKARFLIDRSGKIPKIKSTAKLKTTEFTEYLEKISREVSRIGITLPLPSDQYWQNIN